MVAYNSDMLHSVGRGREDIERIREGDRSLLCSGTESMDDAVRREEKAMEWEAREARIAGDIAKAIRRHVNKEEAAAGNSMAAERLRREESYDPPVAVAA